MDDIIAEFLAETRDSLSELDNDLIALEQNPDDAELISKIFRLVHTIKGTCGFLGLGRLEKVAHHGEDVLGLFRDKKLTVTPAYISLILECFDCIRDIVSGLEATGQEPVGDDSALIAKLDAVAQGEELELPEIEAIEVSDAAHSSVLAAGVVLEESDPASSQEPELQATNGVQTLRVNVDVLEGLMTMVSELVLTRNQLLQISRDDKGTQYQAPLQRLNHVVSELQEGVMKTRMQPIGNAWSKLPRIVRDVCQELGKKIELEMEGKDTELDRQILDMIKDPLTHMVRNSVDHGVESPDERLARGKPETGVIKLNAYHQGGHINIEISDDGKGLPLEKIKEKILKNGLADEKALAEMSVHQIQQYIFHAGFSTAEKVTSVSGRGVGMDVVRSNIEKIGGSIELTSVEGKGTTFVIKIPLTLAIVSSLIVGVGHERFAIPQITISELVLVDENSQSQIEAIDNSRVLRLRGNLLPLVSLAELLSVEKQEVQSRQYIVVTKIGSTMCGLIVDNVCGLEEIVIKPLSNSFRDLSVFAGNTILGDGCVIMILDPAGILKAVGMQEATDKVAEKAEKVVEQKDREELLLLFNAGDETLKAMPMEMISRLEEIDIADIERANGQSVIQYLGHLMPVYDLDQGGRGESTRRPLIILQHEGKKAGLLADKILDVAKFRGMLSTDGQTHIADSVIINDCAADVINARLFASQGIVIHEEGLSHVC